ncbi:MAG: hypothetical protein AAGG44_10580, partial [Planctomycetota bacterium]
MKKGKRASRKPSASARRKDVASPAESPERGLVSSSKPSKLLIAMLVAAGFVVYLLCFFSQPSSLPLQNENGEAVNRLTELLILPVAAQGIFGDGETSMVVVDRVPYLIGMLAWLGLAGWIGGAFTRGLRDSADRVALTAIEVLVGLSLLSTVTLVIGQMRGLASRWPLLLAIVGLVLL